MNGIDFRLLESVVAVAEELSFSRAAARLSISQPAFTKRIHELEERLGVSLFERTPRGVFLTDSCRHFIQEARMALAHLDRAVQRARGSSTEAESVVSIGRSPYTDPYLTTVLTSLVLPLYPKLQIEISGNFSVELTRQVLAGQLDMAVILEGAGSSHLNSIRLTDRPIYILFRKKDGLQASLSLPLRSLAGKRWFLLGRHVHSMLYDTVHRTANEQSVIPKSVHQFQTPEEAAQLISQNGGVGFLHETGAWRALDADLDVRPLDEPSLSIRTALITRRDDESRLVSEFVRMAVKRLKSVAMQTSLPLGDETRAVA